MKGCLLIPLAALVSLALGVIAMFLLESATGNTKLASSIGTGVWLFSFLIILPYGSLWFTPESFVLPPKSDSLLRNWRSGRAERKLQGAELRFGIVLGFLGAVISGMADAPSYVSVIVGISCALVGTLLGFDFKRRVLRIREQHERNQSGQVT
jgi:hypothetical protein